MSALPFILHVITSLLPVLVFLAGLVVIDSFKLVRPRDVVLSVAVGLGTAAIAYLANRFFLGALAVESDQFSRYAAPFIEETLKAAFVVYLIRSSRIGFAVDAAIQGFAVGAGFAFLENLYYLHAIGGAGLGTWVVRGFGTAVMHGGTTAVFSMVSRAYVDRASRARPRLFLPGLGLAIGLHALFNMFLLPPLLTTAAVLAILPPFIVLVYHRSEQATREWLGVGFDTDQELLKLILSGEVVHSPVGRYLETLKAHFPGEVIVDMLCVLRLHVELSIRAKGMLMMHANGFRTPPDPAVRAKLEELRYLEQSIGTTGMLAIHPFLRTSSRDLWQRNLVVGGRVAEA